VATACQRSLCQLLHIEGVAWLAQWIPTVIYLFSRLELLLFLPSSSSVVLMRLSGPCLDPLLLRKSGSAENRTWDLWICNQEVWPLDHRSSRGYRILDRNWPDHELMRLSGPRSRPTTTQKICSTRNWTWDLWICSQELWPLNHRGSRGYCILNRNWADHELTLYVLLGLLEHTQLFVWVFAPWNSAVLISYDSQYHLGDMWTYLSKECCWSIFAFS
jgi:hypothetical protein